MGMVTILPPAGYQISGISRKGAQLRFAETLAPDAGYLIQGNQGRIR